MTTPTTLAEWVSRWCRRHGRLEVWRYDQPPPPCTTDDGSTR